MANKSPFSGKRPPRSVTVCGHKLKVKVVPYLEDDSQELLGAFNGETKTIFLLRGCDWKSVLFHECIHSVLYFTGAGQGLTANREEQITLALENSLGPLLF